MIGISIKTKFLDLQAMLYLLNTSNSHELIKFNLSCLHSCEQFRVFQYSHGRSTIMRLRILVAVLFSIVRSINCNFIAKAIGEVMLNFYAVHDNKIDIVCYGCDDSRVESLVRMIIRLSNAFRIPSRVVRAEISLPADSGLNISSIVFFDSIGTYNRFLENVQWRPNKGSKIQNHLIHIGNLTRADFIKHHEGHHVNVKFNLRGRSLVLGERSLLNINYLIDASNTNLELITLMAFSEKCCQVSQATTLNYFSKASGKWETNNFFPRKSSNLHNCRLYYSFAERMGSDFQWKVDKMTKQRYLTGSAYEIHEAIAKKLNIQAHYLSSREVDKQLASDLEIVVLLTPVFNNIWFSSITQLEIIVYGSDFGFFIPPGQPYSQFEKLFMMFDEDAWLAIAVTLLGGFLILQVLSNLPSRAAHDLVFGEKVRTANMNYIGVIMGIGQTVLPKANFARFLLMMFIILCLVLRTCHQSMLYSLLQMDLRHSELKTIEEAIERNFTFYLDLPTSLALQDTDFYHR